MASETVYLAGGCFWGMQRFLEQIPGVCASEAGYANGPDTAPTYKDVCSDSGHAETVSVTFDPEKLPLGKLLDFYIAAVDPFSVNRQGEDSGIQYRTGIYYTSESQLPVILEKLGELEARSGKKPAIEVAPLVNFFPAEEYHQHYLDKNPGGYCHIDMSILYRN